MIASACARCTTFEADLPGPLATIWAAVKDLPDEKEKGEKGEKGDKKDKKDKDKDKSDDDGGGKDKKDKGEKKEKKEKDKGEDDGNEGGDSKDKKDKAEKKDKKENKQERRGIWSLPGHVEAEILGIARHGKELHGQALAKHSTARSARGKSWYSTAPNVSGIG